MRDSFIPCKYSELPDEAGLVMVCCPDETTSISARIITITKTRNIREFAIKNVDEWGSGCLSVELEYFIALQPEAELRDEFDLPRSPNVG